MIIYHAGVRLVSVFKKQQNVRLFTSGLGTFDIVAKIKKTTRIKFTTKSQHWLSVGTGNKQHSPVSKSNDLMTRPSTQTFSLCNRVTVLPSLLQTNQCHKPCSSLSPSVKLSCFGGICQITDVGVFPLAVGKGLGLGLERPLQKINPIGGFNLNFSP